VKHQFPSFTRTTNQLDNTLWPLFASLFSVISSLFLVLSQQNFSNYDRAHWAIALADQAFINPMAPQYKSLGHDLDLEIAELPGDIPLSLLRYYLTRQKRR
jgi:hypothetical protein